MAKSKGLGDSIANITRRTGLEKLAKAVLGDDCGCAERQEKLNQMFPYTGAEITQDQERRFNDIKRGYLHTVSTQWQKDFYTLYNEVTRSNKKVTSCGSCIKRDFNNLSAAFDACDK